MINQNKPNENNSTSSDIPKIKPKENWVPQKNRYTINTFTEAVNNDVEKLFKHKLNLSRNNLSKHEKNIISEFSKREDLVFTKADKRGASVILDVEGYKKINKELKDGNYYKKSAMIQHRNILKSSTTQLKHFIVNRFYQKICLIF